MNRTPHALLHWSHDEHMDRHNVLEVFEDEQSARAKTKAVLEGLEKKGCFHYRQYKNDGANRRMDMYDRSRWSLKRTWPSIVTDHKKVQRTEVSLFPIEEVFNDRTHKWTHPRWIAYNHYEDDARSLLDDIDAKLLIGSAALKRCEFDQLTSEFSDAVRQSFHEIDEYRKTVFAVGDICLSLYPAMHTSIEWT